ncbi:Ribosomal RNA processing protein 1 [Tolypocladium ophioglossoides CBS 100239]|uniref:Ribosomal RNA processing protein 1 n=1 Tax=Tolypocladium ophioglossoides (strain CBS 100239) TaxID=1163406 RepID=A0A0L0N6E3_TOLOC|nr:Ribosomal RNA processing protein 1 [Tolypocladium ophioglossoides CBS 100239]
MSSKRIAKLRTSALAALQAFLGARAALPAGDAAKLWTGLYYALWMTDRPRPQQALAAALADLLFVLRAGCAAPWLRAFWAVLSTQWPRVDALRMDKFLLLVRRVFAATARWVKQRAYQGAEVAAVVDVLREACFDVDEERAVALGLRLHVLDLWVDELEREAVLAAAEDAEVDAARETFVRAVGDMVEALRRSPVRSVRERAKEGCEDGRLPWGARPGEEDEMAEDEEGEGWGGIED